MQGTCDRRRGRGRCGRPTADIVGQYLTLEGQAWQAQLCADCLAEVRRVFLDGAEPTQWREYAPLVDPLGRLWSPSQVRMLLRALDFGTLVKPGPLGSAARAQWEELVLVYPQALQLVRLYEMFGEDGLVMLAQRVRENREGQSS